MNPRRTIFSLGLALTLMGVAGWIASFWVITWRSSGRHAVVIQEGVLAAHTKGTYTRTGWSCLGLWVDTPRRFRLYWWPYDGVFWESSRDSWGTTTWSACLPLWMPTCAGLVLAVASRRNKRPHGSCCARCAYDLSGLPTVNGMVTACPECGRGGTPAPKRA